MPRGGGGGGYRDRSEESEDRYEAPHSDYSAPREDSYERSDRFQRPDHGDSREHRAPRRFESPRQYDSHSDHGFQDDQGGYPPRGRGRGRGGRGASVPRAPPGKELYHCTYCDMYGHLADFCFSNPDRKQPKESHDDGYRSRPADYASDDGGRKRRPLSDPVRDDPSLDPYEQQLLDAPAYPSRPPSRGVPRGAPMRGRGMMSRGRPGPRRGGPPRGYPSGPRDGYEPHHDDSHYPPNQPSPDKRPRNVGAVDVHSYDQKVANLNVIRSVVVAIRPSYANPLQGGVDSGRSHVDPPQAVLQASFTQTPHGLLMLGGRAMHPVMPDVVSSTPTSSSFMLDTQRGWTPLNKFPYNSIHGHAAWYAESRAVFSSAEGGEKGVWVFGGNIDGRLSNQLIFFSTVDGEWKYDTRMIGGELPTPRSFHSVVKHNQKAFVFGGCTEQGFSSDLFVLDHESLSWSRVATQGVAPRPRAQHSAHIYNQHMVVFGGSNGHMHMNDVQALDLRSMEWRELRPNSSVQPAPRVGYASAIIGPHLLIYGGQNISTQQVFNDLWSFHLDSLEWKQYHLRGDPLPPIAEAPSICLVTPDEEGKMCPTLILFGGQNDKGTFNNSFFIIYIS